MHGINFLCHCNNGIEGGRKRIKMEFIYVKINMKIYLLSLATSTNQSLVIKA